MLHALRRRYVTDPLAALAFAAEIAIATLGGALKRKESLSARLGDVLSELYLLSAVLKRHADDGAPVEDRPPLPGARDPRAAGGDGGT